MNNQEAFFRSKRIKAIVDKVNELTFTELQEYAKDLRRILLDNLSDDELNRVYERECAFEIIQKQIFK